MNNFSKELIEELRGLYLNNQADLILITSGVRKKLIILKKRNSAASWELFNGNSNEDTLSIALKALNVQFEEYNKNDKLTIMHNNIIENQRRLNEINNTVLRRQNNLLDEKEDINSLNSRLEELMTPSEKIETSNLRVQINLLNKQKQELIDQIKAEILLPALEII